MGRYRAPQAKASPYITLHGYTILDHELKQIWQRRRTVTQALAEAAAEGDRSENAEYIYRKKELREIDRRLRYLQKRLPELTVVSEKPSDASRVYFGAWVTVIDEQGLTSRYRIVGADETSHHKQYISLDSPLAKSLMHRALGDEITVPTPKGKQTYFVEAIEY